MKPPKSLPIGQGQNDNRHHGNSYGGGGGGKSQRQQRSFGEVTDDTFRNYMSRKIELQRRQFGLVVPPPPSPSPPPSPLLSACPSPTSDLSGILSAKQHIPMIDTLATSKETNSKQQFQKAERIPRTKNENHSKQPAKNSQSQRVESLDKHSNINNETTIPMPQITATTTTARTNNSQPRKSVRFRQESMGKDENTYINECENTDGNKKSAQSLSQVLIHLKQRHGKRKRSTSKSSSKSSTSPSSPPSSRKRSRDKMTSLSTSTSQAKNDYDVHGNTLLGDTSLSPNDNNRCGNKDNRSSNNSNSSSPNQCTSVLGILNNLQKRHGSSSSSRNYNKSKKRKKKRQQHGRYSSTEINPSSSDYHHHPSNTNKTKSVLEMLDSSKNDEYTHHFMENSHNLRATSFDYVTNYSLGGEHGNTVGDVSAAHHYHHQHHSPQQNNSPTKQQQAGTQQQLFTRQQQEQTTLPHDEPVLDATFHYCEDDNDNIDEMELEMEMEMAEGHQSTPMPQIPMKSHSAHQQSFKSPTTLSNIPLTNPLVQLTQLTQPSPTMYSSPFASPQLSTSPKLSSFSLMQSTLSIVATDANSPLVEHTANNITMAAATANVTTITATSTTITSASTLSNETPPRKKNTNHNQNHGRPDLFFTGIVTLINGHTNPDSTTLMRLLHKHGGDLEKYETRRVTHIIAERLSTAKANIYKKQRNPIPVVRPEWIVESVDSGRLLDYREYLIQDVREEDVGVRSVRSFFHKEKKMKKKGGEEQDMHAGGGFGMNCLVEGRQPDNSHRGQVASPSKRRVDPSNSMSPKKPNSLNSPAKLPSPINDASDATNRWGDKPPSKSNYLLNGQVRTVGNDPNFLESYFSNSRLSYIGSFKQRVKSTTTSGNNGTSSRSKIGAQRFVLLVDMDCFFVSVALRKYPQHRNKPVAVGHSSSNKSGDSDPNDFASRSKNSSSELSTCNYIARSFGIRKGMFLGDAIQLCPELVVLPYDFAGFEEVAGVVADILLLHAEQYEGCVEIVSCDEAYVEIFLEPEDYAGVDVESFVQSLAERIRSDIFDRTECTASIGVGQNKLLAKLGADKVKPDACCVVRDWKEFLDGLSLRDVPGVGYKLQRKLEPHDINNVNDVWDLGDDAERTLGEIVGQGNAKKIVKYCHGQDDRPVTPAVRKTIGAECNYGVRFDGPYGVDYMMSGLAKEVEKRMTAAGVRGSKITLKAMKSKDSTKMPGKFLGHGKCDNLSKSADIPLTRNHDVLSRAGMKLFERLGVDKHLLRGMGIVISSLTTDNVASLHEGASKLSAWLKKDTTKSKEAHVEEADSPDNEKRVTFAAVSEFQVEEETSHQSDNTHRGTALPTLSQLDEEVLRQLPPDILSEVRSTYKRGSRHSESSEKTESDIAANGLKADAAAAKLPTGDPPLLRDEGTFVVPSMSQIDLDEVMELPPEICDEILKQIGNKSDATKPAVTDSAQQTSQSSRRMKQAHRKRNDEKSIPLTGQVSVKRMLKLASIKSGVEECSNFRLSQLDCLPLETQLQLANDDNIKITKQPSQKRAKSTVRRLEEESEIEVADQSSDGPAGEDIKTQTNPMESFYLENILPLKRYILSIPDPGDDEISFVQEFLTVCVNEHRYDDAITLLRAIKNMENGWDELLYVQIRDAIVHKVFTLSGNQLDLQFLRL